MQRGSITGNAGRKLVDQRLGWAEATKPQTEYQSYELDKPVLVPRRHTRYVQHHEGILSVEVRSGLRAWNGTVVKDISAGGMHLHSDKAHRHVKGATLHIVITKCVGTCLMVFKIEAAIVKVRADEQSGKYATHVQYKGGAVPELDAFLRCQGLQESKNTEEPQNS